MDKKTVQFVQAALALASNTNLVLDGIVGPKTRAVVSSVPKVFRSSVDSMLASMGKPSLENILASGVAEASQGKKFGKHWQEFVRAAYQVVPSYGFNPEWIIAQAALESDWGNRVPTRGDGRSSYNFGGIKSNSARQPKSGVVTRTREFIKGEWVTVTADWAVYDSASAYVHGYFDYVLNLSDLYRRPKNPVGNLREAKTFEKYFSILKAGGYATDPRYVSKMQSMVASVRQRYPKEQWT